MPIRDAFQGALDNHAPKVVRSSIEAMDNVRTSMSSVLRNSIAEG